MSQSLSAIRRGFQPTYSGEFWDLNRPQDFDNWFVATWSSNTAINKPAGDIRSAAVRFSRATVRQAWQIANEATAEYILKPALDDYKILAEKAGKIKVHLAEFRQWLGTSRYTATDNDVRSALTRNILLWLEASPLDQDGGWLQYDLDTCRSFAESLLNAEALCNALESDATQQVFQNRKVVQNVGKPEYVAFALPFVEAWAHMTGALLPIGDIAAGNAIETAWQRCCGPEHNDWQAQIRVARRQVERDLLSLKRKPPKWLEIFDRQKRV